MKPLPANDLNKGFDHVGATAANLHLSASRIASAGTIALAVAMGIGRFAFTPLMPMMLHDGATDLAHGSLLATANYLGYLVGALLCMAMPRVFTGAAMIRLGLVATILLTAGMALPAPVAWPVLRFAAGIASALVFVYSSGWCLTHLAHRDRAPLGAIIFTGPGLGIALSGFVASALVALHQPSWIGWLVFAGLALALSAICWHVFRGPDMPAAMRLQSAHHPGHGRAAKRGSAVEMSLFSLAYGLAGFGYIITATYLPVIARTALPGSVWLDLFWPILGLGVVTGALIAARVPPWIDPRHLLIACYLVQAFGVVLCLILPSLVGFILSSFLVGLPFTALSFFAMQDVRRLRPEHAARFMGLLTAVYGIGQIVGPPLAAHLLAISASPAAGFAKSLGTGSAALLVGAGLYLVMRLCWPIDRKAGH
jgi:MFS family permease